MALHYTSFQLLNGQVGTVVEEDKANGWDPETEEGYFKGKRCELISQVMDIENFDFSDGTLTLIRGDGYRGECCYEGYFEKNNGRIFWLDIMNEGCVWSCSLKDN